MEEMLRKIPLPSIMRPVVHQKLYAALLSAAGKQLTVAEAGSVLAEGMDAIREELKGCSDRVELAFALFHGEFVHAMTANQTHVKGILDFSGVMLRR
jgi:hypothetical protein